MSLNKKIVSTILNSIILIIVFIFALSPSLQAQNCNRNSWEWPGHNNWFLATGGTGGISYMLDQKNQSVTSVIQTDPCYNCAWDASTTKIRGYQGVATASNDKGELVFFTNGRKAWDAEGKLITDMILSGNECGSTEDMQSAVHGVMTVRHPLNPAKYYIISIDDIVSQGSPSVNNQIGDCGNGITFAVIDSSGSLGHPSQPIERDVSTGTIGAFRTTEDFAATFHANGVDIWITFHPLWQTHVVSYLLTCDGFVTPPVISGQGKVPYVSIFEGNGGLDFSPDGSRLALGAEINLSGPNVDSKVGSGSVNLYDFNNKNGEITSRKAIYHRVNGTQNFYNLFFSADGNELHYGGSGGGGKYDVSSNDEATILLAGSQLSSTFSSGDKFAGGAMNYQGVLETSHQTFAKYPETSSNRKWSSNSIYIPPLEEPDMIQIGKLCDTSKTKDIHTYWRCAGTSAEDTATQKHSYFLLDSLDASGATHDLNSATVIGEKTGIFDPVAAGPGTHKIVFEYCEMNDTMEILVEKCPACKAKLKDVFPTMCTGNDLRLDTMIMVATGIRTWTIDSFPSNSGTNASLNITPSDTLFDALANDARWGTYKLKLKGTYNLETCYDTMYVRVDSLPIPYLGVDTIVCANWDSVIFDAGAYSAFDWGADGGNFQTITKLESKTFSVEVTDGNGCKGSDDIELTINTLPIADLGNDTAICAGDLAITFNASTKSTGGGGSAITKYTWDNGTSGPTKTTDVDGEYWVAIEDANRCHDTDSVVIIVHTLPDVKLRSDTSICAGDNPINFIAFDGIANDTTYTWSTGEIGTLIAKDTAGIYKVVMEDKFGCLDSDSVELKINMLPIIELRDSIICKGAPAVIFDAKAATPGMTSYTWNGTLVSETFTTLIDGKYWVIIEDDKQCSDTDSVTLTVNTFVPVEIGPNKTRCVNEPDVLFDAGIEGANNYAWAKEDLTIVGVGQTFSTGDAGKYYLALVDSNGCPGADSIELTVNALPNVDLGNDKAICLGDPNVVFDAGNIGVGMKYSWMITGETGQTYSTNIDSAYWVAIEDVNGCSDTDTVVLTVHPLPLVTVNNEEICQGDPSATFTATATTAISYIWSDKGSGSQNTTSDSKAGNYTVEVTDINGCKGTATGSLIVKALPVVTVNSPEICKDDPAAIFTVGSDSAIVSYIWSDKGSGTDPTSSGIEPGNYKVEIIDKNTCSGTAIGILTVHPLPIVGNEPKTICEGDAEIIGETVTGGVYNYVWLDRSENSATIEVENGGTYTRTVTSANNCVSTSSYEVTENLNPIIEVDNETLCDGEEMILNDKEQNTGYSYEWAPGNHTTPSIKPTQNQTYTIKKINNTTNCFKTDEVTATFIAIPNVDINESDTIDICEGKTANISAIHDADGILWTTGSINDNTTETVQGNVYAKVSNGECSVRDSVFIRVTQYPISELNKEIEQTPICFAELDSIITLTASSNRDYNYQWGGDINETTNSFNVTAKGTYFVSITDNNCETIDHVTVKDFCPSTLYVPNTFTPDGDGLNDVFTVRGTYISNYKMLIYDRWGILLYETEDMNVGWDGTYMSSPVQIDTYVYKVYYSINDKSGSLVPNQKVGHINVLR